MGEAVRAHVAPAVDAALAERQREGNVVVAKNAARRAGAWRHARSGLCDERGQGWERGPSRLPAVVREATVGLVPLSKRATSAAVVVGVVRRGWGAPVSRASGEAWGLSFYCGTAHLTCLKRRKLSKLEQTRAKLCKLGQINGATSTDPPMASSTAPRNIRKLPCHTGIRADG